MQLHAMLGREEHVGEYVLFGIIHQVSELGHRWSKLISHLAPLDWGGLGGFLRISSGDERGDDTVPAPPSMSDGIAGRMRAAALPNGAENAGHRRIDTLIGVGDDKLHTAQVPPRQIAQEIGSESLGFRCAMVMSSTSPRPSLLTPTAMVIASAPYPPVGEAPGTRELVD